jgi:hypothetical protein
MVESGPRDRGDLVVGWLAKIAVIIAIFAVGGLDSVTAIQANVTARDQAGSAATAGEASYAANHDVQGAYQAALADAKASNSANVIKPADFTVTTKGVVTLKLTRPIHTLVAHYLPIASVRTAVGTGSAEPGP